MYFVSLSLESTLRNNKYNNTEEYEVILGLTVNYSGAIVMLIN